MLKLNFKRFQKNLDEGKRNGHFPTVHCMVQDDRFTFITKSKDKWEYYTDMLYEDIFSFAQKEGIDTVQAIDMFVINYCSNTLPIEAAEFEKLMPERVIDIAPENQGNTVSKDSTTNHPQEIDAGNDLIVEAKDYSDFLLKFFNRLEKQVLAATNKLDIKKHMTTKTFGEFLKSMFDIVNSLLFAKQVRKYIKADLVNGLVSAEAELNTDIGFTEVYSDKLNQLASQQIAGYTINGKLWPGIKGVTKEIQASVIQTVQAGINENIGLEGIKENIQKNFSNFSDWRAEMIARTETTRITNEGKILGYKESGVAGVKVWITAIDNRTSDICKRLNGKAAGLDDLFIDPVTLKGFSSPPAHCNCRSTIRFKPK